ncbi:hypothetical protein SNE40_000338 [Patella caerulea]|uniref:Uncharacterized protein n=1 Tax=Patella caerulea TaxID=87958 RepID=A0AAN8KL16_PATCE
MVWIVSYFHILSRVYVFCILILSTRSQCPSTRGCYPKLVVEFLQDVTNQKITLDVNSNCDVAGQYEGLGVTDGTTFSCSVDATKVKMRDKETVTVDINNETTIIMNPNYQTYWQSEKTVSANVATPVTVQITAKLGNRFTIKDTRLYFKSIGTPFEIKVDSRPQAMFIERLDNDNVTWKPWRYYADNCADFPGVIVQQKDGPSRNATTPFCTEDKEIFGGFVTGGPNDTYFVAFNPAAEYGEEFTDNKAVADYYITSGVRINLVKPRYETPLQSYYAVSDFQIDGHCYCYGHSSKCKGDNLAECECEHNTMGTHCEICQPLYNNRTWQIGKQNQANECQKCACNDHATSCRYDATLGYGVCEGCANNTRGEFCDQCNPGYTMNPYFLRDTTNETTPLPKPNGTCEALVGKTLTSYDCGSYCIPCGCNADGTTVAGLTNCSSSGDCDCKTNVQGQKCAECKDNYWGLAEAKTDGCEACVCESKGILNNTNMCNKTTGDCFCKENTQGRTCDTCKDETWGLSETKDTGCIPCDCDPGASISNTCKVDSGQCDCRTNIANRDCRTTLPNSFAPKLDYFRFDAEFQTNVLAENKIDRIGEGVADGTVSGRGLISIPASTNTVQLQFTTKLNKQFDVVLRYETPTEITGITGDIKQLNGVEYTCNGVTIAAANTWTIPTTIQAMASRGGLILTRLCGRIDQSYTLTLTTPSTTGLLIDSVVLLPVITELQTYIKADNDTKVKLEQCREASIGVNMPNRQSLNCTTLEYSLMTELVGGAIGCACSTTGAMPNTVCDQYGGQCECKDGVTLRDCSICRVDSYGLDITGGCTLCNCHFNGSAKLSCNMTGDCSCRTNVTGQKCDACLPEQYGLNSGNGCQPCTCNLQYAINNTCQDDGQCWCKPGIGGKNCDKCLDGFYNLTSDYCTECGCNVEGSVGGVCNDVTGICSCKAKTMGDKCDQCQTGYFGVGSWSDEGCIKCFCSEHTTNCTTGEGWYRSEIASSWGVTNSAAVDDRWLGIDSEGNNVMVDDPLQIGPPPQYVMRIMNSENNLNKSHLYFLSPAKYIGSKRTAYGQFFTMALRLSTHEDLLGNYTEGDVCMKGKYTDFVLAKNLSLPGTTITYYNVTLKESEWFINGTENRQPTYEEFMQVLTDIEFIKVRGKYSNASDAETDLFAFKLYTASKNNESMVPINNVELCSCPPEYTGEFCELCASGYKREVPNGGPFSACVACKCNGHGGGGPCNVTTGACTCTHNTTGLHCDVCMDGFYGNALAGTPDDCKPCMCPGNVIRKEDNVFATKCELDAGGGGPKCTNCTEGHGGNRCETCVTGYYGQPENTTVNDGKCVPCLCNGRADTCDTVTGICVNCRNNTAGKECEICAAKYSGDAMTDSCKPCTCNSTGSDGECDPSTGQCKCFPNVQGFTCDQCVPNSYNFTSGRGCDMCDCNSEGAIGTSCDQTSGQCTCRNKVINRRCDGCEDTYFRLNKDTGCDPCGCSGQGIAEAVVGGKAKGSCDLATGQCYCSQPGIIGLRCDTCSKNTKETYSAYISVINIGIYPGCVLCGECFDGWARKIDTIGLELDNVTRQTTTIRSHYGLKTSESIQADLTAIETSIQNANQSVTRAQNITSIVDTITQDLNLVLEDMRNVSAMIIEMEARLNASLVTLETVYQYNGVVNVNNESVTADILDTKLTNLSTEIKDAFSKANASFAHIKELSILVGSAEQTTTQLQARVTTSMSILSAAEQTLANAVNVYNGTFSEGYNDNERGLSEINSVINSSRVILADLNTVIAEMTSQFNSANESVTMVIQKTNEVRDSTQAKLQESQEAYNQSVALSTASLETYNSAMKYKAGAEAALRNITSSFEAIIAGSKMLIDVKSKMAQSRTKVTEVNAFTIRPNADMTAITQQIVNTSISTADVDAAKLSAQNALETAKSVLNVTEKALDDSRLALNEVTGIQKSIDDANTLRSNATTLKAEADTHNTTIYQALSQSSTKVNQVRNLVTTTTAGVTNVQSFIATVTKCFQEKNSQVTSARSLAAGALTKAEALETSQSNYGEIQANLTQAVTNKTTSQAVADLQNTNKELESIKSDLATAEQIADLTAMSQEYAAQKQEMTQLETEIKALETELNDMLQSLGTTSDASVCLKT